MQTFLRRLAMFCAGLCLAAALLNPAATRAQVLGRAAANHIAADLVAEAMPAAGETIYAALRFHPQEGWHGYWANPGDAGLGMELAWDLPPGWQAGEPLYPVPRRKVLLGVMNHVYEQPYTVLVPIRIAAENGGVEPFVPAVDARWLACSDQLCVPETARLTLRFAQPGEAVEAQFDAWRAAIPPLLDQQARLALTGDTLRLAIPLPQAVALADPHLFIVQKDVIDYAAPQRFWRQGDLLLVEIARGGLHLTPDRIEGILALGGAGEGVRFVAAPGDVPAGGTPLGNRAGGVPLLVLLASAVLGGLLLNLMPCVFPVLSLKALALARAGGEERQARAEALAYTAGTVLACLLLGATLLALRAGGEQVGWAFQLQQPLVVAALLVLAVLISANFAGLYALPALSVSRRGETGAFATGLLAAVVATPCTGPFMAAALGAALLLPAAQAMALFAALGLGLALPFLLLGFVPALRRMLPRPGAWMETFRKAMAIPMGLTALALVWLAWRLAGSHFAFAALAVAMLALVLLVALRQGRKVAAALALVAGLYFAGSLPFRVEDRGVVAAESLLDPVAFSETALAEARASGRPVFVWFTADWCLTCKVNESVAIERDEVRAAFAAAGVIPMRGDWTRADPEITRFLEAQGAAGVPLYLWYRPGSGEGEQLPQVLTAAMLVERAETP